MSGLVDYVVSVGFLASACAAIVWTIGNAVNIVRARPPRVDGPYLRLVIGARTKERGHAR